MPQTVLNVYQDANGGIPLQKWLSELEDTDPLAFEKCVALLLRLEQHGYELRRPHADMLRDGIYELRFRLDKVRYRILYFFHGRNAVVLSHGFSKKQARVPPGEIDKAISRMELVKNDPDTHLAQWDE